MAGIDIFSIKPSVISRDLSGKSFFIYGEIKSGKTSNAVKFPKPLIIGMEKGWNMLSGVIGQPINKWTEALEVKKQLLKEAREVEKGEKSETTFKTIIMDTATIGYNKCVQYTLDKEGVEYLDETKNSRGYGAAEKEFDTYFQELVKAGYTVIAIAHAETKQVKEGKEKFDRIMPMIDKRGMRVLSGLCDVVGYSTLEEQEDGSTQAMLYMRGRKDLVAGTRSPYMSEKIPFTYDALLADMQQAIDRQEKEGAVVTNKPTEVYKDQTVTRDYKFLQKEIQKVGNVIAKASSKDVVTAIIEEYLGRDSSDEAPRTVGTCTSAQADILELILAELEDKAKELGV